MKYTFGDFLGMIDNELQQKVKSSLTSLPDRGRNANQAEVAQWTNESLSKLSNVNEKFWYRTEMFTVHNDSDKISLPFYWRRLDTIIVDGIKYKVGSITDLSREFYHEQGNIICSRSGMFSAGTEIVFEGIFRPVKIPANGDLNSYVDMDEDWINLLKLSVCLQYAARQDLQKSFWYSQYVELLKMFESARPAIHTVGRYVNPVRFGDL